MSVKANVTLAAVMTLGVLSSGCGNRPVLSDGTSVVPAVSTDTYSYSDNNFTSGDISEIVTSVKEENDALDTNGETEISDEKLEKADNFVTEFMNGFLYHDFDVFMQYSGAQSFSTYEFLNGVYLTDWKIVDTVVYDDEKAQNKDKIFTYVIKLNVDKSDNELFPIGESLWELDFADKDMSYFSSFRPEGTSTENIIFDGGDFSTAVNMCYSFTSGLGWACDKENSIINVDGIEKRVEKELFVNNIVYFCKKFDCGVDEIPDGYSCPVDWIEKSAEKLVGVNGFDFTSVPMYNAEENTVSIDASKRSLGYAVLSDESYDESSGLHTVVIDWYADTIYLAKALTLQYTLTDNEDGTLKLLSAEKLYSSGERPVYYSEDINVEY